MSRPPFPNCDPSLTQEELTKRLRNYPRCQLCYLPTPLERMDRLSRQTAGLNLFVKRDDQTGLAMGGNKARKLDFIMADALKQSANTLITWAGLQSNWCRQAAAAARKVGMKPLLVLFKRSWLPTSVDGNLLLDSLLGAEIRTVEMQRSESFDDLSQVQHIINDAVEDERKAGRKAYVAPIGGSRNEGSMKAPLGAIAYAAGLVEIVDQASTMGFRVDYIVLATSSGSTQAGLVAAARIAFPQIRIVGISVGSQSDDMRRRVAIYATQSCKALGTPGIVVPEDVEILDEFVGEGYGILTPGATSAIKTVAECEGIFLDPVYTGKAMAGLLQRAHRNYFEPGSNVVFLHTGGSPLLFPYRDELMK